MTLRERVLCAPNVKEAIGLLADELERQHAELAKLKPSEAWTAWDQVTEDKSSDTVDNDKVHLESALAKARQELSEATDPDDQRALAARVELFEDELKGGTIPPPDEGQRTEQIVSPEGDVIVEVPKVSVEKEHERMLFAEEQLRLAEAYPDHGDTLVASYAVAGPLLLYYTDRDFVISQPDRIKKLMIEDVMEIAPMEAIEFGRDILKDSQSEAPSFG